MPKKTRAIFVALSGLALLFFLSAASLATAAVWTETPIVSNSFDQVNPSISGNAIVWQDYRYKATGCPSAQNCTAADIFARQLPGGSEQRLTTTTNALDPDISGNLVTWRNWDTGKIVVHNLTSGAEQNTSTAAAQMVSPSISGNRVVWVDYRNSVDYGDIYLRDVTHPADEPVSVASGSASSATKDKRNPDIDGDIVAWEDMRNAFQDAQGWWHNPDIYVKNLTTGVESAVCTNLSDQYNPVVSGHSVFWQDYRNGNWDIYEKDLDTGIETRLTTNTAFQSWPSASGNFVVWKDQREGDEDIYIKNLTDSTEVRVNTDPVSAPTASQKLPSISGNLIAWMDKRAGNWDIYMAPDSVSPEVTSITPAGYSNVSPVTITATYTDSGAGVDPASVVVNLDGAPLSGCTVTGMRADCPAGILSAGVSHAVDVSIADYAGNAGSGGGSFILDLEAPAISAISPSGIIAASDATITASFTDAVSGVNPVTLSVTLDGLPLAGCTATADSVSCPATGISQGVHNISVDVADIAGNHGVAGDSFMVDTVSPAVETVTPSGAIPSTDATIAVAYTDADSGVNAATATVTLDGLTLSGCTATAASVSCPVSGLAVGAHAIGGHVADHAGNTAAISGSFSVSALTPGLTSMVSSDSAGVPGNASSYNNLAISGNGNFTVFASPASNLVSGDSGSGTDIFMKDNRTGQTTMVSTSQAGVKGSNLSNRPSVTGDGRYVAFRSAATNLVAGDTNGAWDIFRKDTLTGEVLRASTASDSVQANGSSDWPAISDDGRYIAFLSSASNLVAGDTNAAADVFVKDLLSGQTVRVSTDAAGIQATGASEKLDISADGRYVAFRSQAANLVAGDTNGKWDIFFKDTVTGAITCLSAGANADSGWPSISDDGNWVTYPADASNLVPGDTNANRDIMVASTLTGQITRVSTDSTGAQVAAYCGAPSISADGRYVAFFSAAANLVAGDTNANRDIFRKDTLTGAVVRYSTSSSGVEANSSTDYPVISADGVYIAYVSQASNLVDGDTNGVWDVFLGSKTPPVVTGVRPSGTINSSSATVEVDYTDGQNDIDPASVIVTLDGSPLAGCLAGSSGASCPVTGLASGHHSIGGSVSDQVGSTTPISSGFDVMTDIEPPAITSVLPSGAIPSTDATIAVAYTDADSGVNAATATVTLDGLTLSGCTATAASVSCPVSGLAVGAHAIGGHVADHAGNTAAISGSFSVSALTPGLTSMVSSDSAGVPGNASSYNNLAISGNGNFTVFASPASNLVSGDSGSGTDIFMKDNRTGQTTMVSTSQAGVKGSNLSNRPSVTGDGRYVAFRSAATNLVAGDTNGAWDIFRKDTLTGEVLRASTASDSVQANGSSDWPAISDDGRYIAFLSSASNLVAGDTNAAADVFVKDLLSGQTVRVSTDAAGIQATGASEKLDISADGRYVAFRSQAANLVAGDTNGKWDIFFKDTVTGAITCLSAGANADSGWPSISDDGNWVTYPADASNLVPGDTNANRDIMVASTLTGQITRVSTDSTGAQVAAYCGAPSISADGRYVAFFSAAANLVAGDTNANRDIFRKDTLTGAVVRYSTSSSGVEANSSTDYPVISADGVYIAYVSQASNLVDGDTNGVWDVFLGSKTP